MNSDSNTRAGADSGGGRPAWRRVPRTQVLLALAALLLFDLSFYYFAALPLTAREQEQNILLDTLARQVEQKTAEARRLKDIVGKVEQAREEGDGLMEEVMLLRGSTYSTLLAELDAAATEAGIEIRERSYDPDPIDGAEQYGAITITATFRGKYESLVKLLNRLDRSRQFLIIGSLGATPRADSNDLDLTMKIDAFVRDL